MRHFVILAALFFAFGFHADSAWADKRLSGHYTKAQVKKDCDSAGGTYGEGAGGSYGCDAPNGNSVICGGSTCYGNCGWKNPDCAFRRQGVSGILHHRPPSAGIKSSGGNAPPKHRRRPVNVRGLRMPAAGMKQPDGGHSEIIPRRAAGRQVVHHSGQH